MVKTISKENSIVAYKAFDANFKCRGFQYAPGMSYHIDGEVKLCENGFHACQDLMNTFDYYRMHNSRYAIVKLWGDVSFGIDKICASDIEIVKELSLKDVVEHYVASKVDFLENKDYDYMTLNAQEKELLNHGKNNHINSIYDRKKIISRGSYNTIVSTGASNTIFDLGYYSIINCHGVNTRLVEIGCEAKITLTNSPTAILYGNDNTITLLDKCGIVISNGKYCTINIISNITADFPHCVTNGWYNRINATGRNVIESNGINDELILSSNYIIFKAKYGSSVTCLGKEKMIVGESELKADTWYTYNFGTIEYNDIFNQREKNKSK